MARIVVCMEGGIVQSIFTDDPDVQVRLIDHDTDSTPETELTTIRFGDGEESDALLFERDAYHDPEFVDHVFDLETWDEKSAKE